MSLRVAVKKSDFVHVDNTVHILLCLGGAENFTALVRKTGKLDNERKNKIRKGRATYTIGQVKCKKGAARHQKSSKIPKRDRMTVERLE